jgi:hypothetical protein
MTTEIVINVSGFLFLFILVLFIAMMALGYGIGLGDYDSDAKQQKINKDPKKFKVSIVVALIHHISVITLAIMLFIAFSSYNIILGIVWTIFRIGEGLILIYNEKSYWGLLNIARQYSVTSGAEKKSLSDLCLIILQTRDTRFTFAMILWSIGTLAFSIVLVTSGVVPLIIGWLGIVAGILVFFHNGIKLVKPDFKVFQVFKVLSGIGGPLAILFEVSIGVWLIIY